MDEKPLPLANRQPQTPAPGQIVHYRLNAGDADTINSRRSRSEGARIGNSAVAGDTYPAMIVRRFDGATVVNLQVWLDGDDAHWATSRREGDEPGTWCWPPRV